jgi:hypothetical protein
LILVIFKIGSHFMPRGSWTTILLFMLSHSWDDRHEPPCSAFIGGDGSLGPFT